MVKVGERVNELLDAIILIGSNYHQLKPITQQSQLHNTLLPFIDLHFFLWEV